jgi:UDP-N-acetylglucosamine--N-acetylmuramyl-(pentapeptide) pyrophosphoryl-undecaprenol N-acetylglucosamine transferase
MGFAAFLRRVPLYLQEQNVSVGIANRTLGKLARRIFLGFGEAKNYFPAGKCIATGNPIRKEFLVSDFPTFDPNGSRLLVFGGSQGAKAVNDAIIEMLPDLYRRYPNLSILHQTGEKELTRVQTAYRDRFPGQHEVVPFIHDMAKAYAEASMVVSRSGALTISELVQVGRPALLVPFPRKGQNDQTANAQLLEGQGAAKTVEQGDQFQPRFEKAFHEMFSPPVLREMSARFSGLRVGNAIVTIGDQIETDLRPKKV